MAIRRFRSFLSNLPGLSVEKRCLRYFEATGLKTELIDEALAEATPPADNTDADKIETEILKALKDRKVAPS